MTRKYFGVLLLALALVIPAGANAQVQKGPKDDVKQIVKEAKKELKATSTATSSEEKRAEAKDKVFRLADGLDKAISTRIAKIKNIIIRLTNGESIIAKLDAKGVNTTSIKAKLAEAGTLATKAETELSDAKAILSYLTSTSSSTVKSLKVEVANARKLMRQSHTDVKLALTKIKEARKLIGQIPKIREIEAGTATTTATSTATSTNN